MSSLTSLAKDLLNQAEKIDQILEQNKISSPSFENDTLELLPDDAQNLRLELLDTSHKLRQLARGARLSGLDIAYGWTEQVILRIIWRYKLASTVPINGSATYQEISAASGLSVSLVFRTIRAAIPLNIFDESDPGRVCHSAISKLLATNEGYYNAIGLQVEDLGPASLRLIEAWEKFGDDAGEANQSAFSLSNSGRSLFNVLAEEPDRAHRFDSAMRYCFVEDKDLNLLDIVKAFDWSKLDKPGAHLVDLGGGYGQTSQVLAQHTKNLSFTVQDLPHVVEQGQAQAQEPPEFRDRITFQAQNFLEPQQSGTKPPDAYLISRCLHNWSDLHSVRVLRNLVPTLQKGSRVLIWDSVLDDAPVKKLSERFNLQQDFIMATISNGKDRSAKEFRQVVELSDARFKIESITKLKGCKLSMIEVSWSGESQSCKPRVQS